MDAKALEQHIVICSCVTKTPEVKYHQPWCSYRQVAALKERIEALEGRQSKMKILEFNGYGPTAPRVYLPAQNIISFHLIDFNGNYGTHIDLPEWRYIRVGAYPEEVKKKLEAALLPGGGE